MKKTYISPICEAFTLPTGKLMQMPVSGGKTATGDDGGWSKKFWGLTDEEEEDEKEFAWD